MINNRPNGIIAWMANNSVAANIFLLVLLVGGLIQLSGMKQEIFPEFQLDFITVTTVYKGASPDEIETGIVLPIEEAVRGIDGVKHVFSTAREGSATVTIECLLGADTDKVGDDVKSAVDQIRTFPKDAEKPITKRIVARNEVISLVIFGDVGEDELRHYGEVARDGLLGKDGVTLVELIGIKNREIAIEIPYQNLLANDITLGAVAEKLSLASVEVSAGQLKTKSHELALRTNDKLNVGNEYSDVVIKSTRSGEQLRLNEIGTINDTFEDEDKFSRYNNHPAVMVKVFRTGEQKPTEIAHTVKDYQKQFDLMLPRNISSALWNDYSEFLTQRIDLLIKNALLGLVLVFIVLGMFLELRLAFWVTMGIPASFLGSFLLLPMLGVSINMLSLFAFIVTLGMVVDDAIVIGENIYSHRQNHEPRIHSAIRGAKEISVPVVFAILTTMAAFTPLFFVPGVMGKFFFVLPTIVIIVLLMSLLESLLILPNHLAHAGGSLYRISLFNYIHQKQQSFSEKFLRFVERYYRPLVLLAIRNRYTTVACSLALLILIIGIVAGGRLKFSFMPNMDSDIVLLHAEYSVGRPVSSTKKLEDQLLTAADRALKKLGGKDKALGFFSQIGSSLHPGGPSIGLKQASGGHILDIMVYLVSTEKRSFSSKEFAHQWEKELGHVIGLKALTFKSTTGPDAGKPVSLLLKHKDIGVLEKAATRLKEILMTYEGLTSVEDGIADGREQIEFKLKDSANNLGITSSDLGLQVRNAFFGAEALRRQRGRDEVKVMVRLPKNERASIYDIENFRVQTTRGEVLLQDIADIKRGISYSSISREDGARVLTVSADVVDGVANANEVMADIKKNVIPLLTSQIDGLEITKNGEQREQADTMKSLGLGFLLSMVLIYALLAIPLKSYVQPFIIMSAIPFGIIGAILGHLLMGFNLSIISMMGFVALAGIVVNDSLVFVHAANHMMREGCHIEKSISDAGVRRFRPILLTSLTTFFGLVPMILETSLQARFLIPMAISIGFGVMFATGIILVLVPALYVITEDVNIFLRNFFLMFKKPAVVPMDEQAHGEGH